MIKRYIVLMLLLLTGVTLYGCATVASDSILKYHIKTNSDNVSIEFKIGSDEFKNTEHGRNVSGMNMPYKIYWYEINTPDNEHAVLSGSYNSIYSQFVFNITLSFEYLNKFIVVVINSHDNTFSLTRTILVE